MTTLLQNAAQVTFRDNLINSGGPSADLLLENQFDIGVLRPWREFGKSWVTRTIDGVEKVMLSNTPATLTREAWILYDNVIQRAVRERLRLVGDIRGAGLTYNLPNGMAHTVLQYQTVGDITDATISMDPIRRSEGDRPHSDKVNLPLPIIHKDFDYSAREISVSRNGNMPLDTTTAELAARKVAEAIEKLATGTVGTFAYGGGTVYGLENLASRSTKSDFTAPTGSNGSTTVNEVLALRQLLINNTHTGPFRLYMNKQWSQFLDNDFSTTKGDQTLRQRLLAIEDIQAVTTLDFLTATNYTMALVEMDSMTIRMVVGMEPQLVQWESLGGMMKHFKVMAMIIPQLRADTAGNAGIGIGSSATP